MMEVMSACIEVSETPKMLLNFSNHAIKAIDDEGVKGM